MKIFVALDPLDATRGTLFREDTKESIPVTVTSSKDGSRIRVVSKQHGVNTILFRDATDLYGKAVEAVASFEACKARLEDLRNRKNDSADEAEDSLEDDGL